MKLNSVLKFNTVFRIGISLWVRFLPLLISFLGIPLWAQTGPMDSVAIPGEYLVKFKNHTPSGLVAQKLVGKAQLKSSFTALNIYHISIQNSAQFGSGSTSMSYEEIKNDPDVEFIEPNYVVKLADDGVVNKPLSLMTSEDIHNSMSSVSGSYSQSANPVNVNEAWSIMSQASSLNKIVVAVIDTGLDVNHEVFQLRSAGGTSGLWINTGEIPGNFVDDDLNGYVDDVNGWNFSANNANPNDDQAHGTHVAGIILGTGQDILTVPLQESKIKIMPLKFLAADGSGSTSNAIKAIYYAIANGARVINNSWGGSSYSRSLHEAFTYAYSKKVLLVNAAGNYSKNNDSVPMYPANFDVPGSISVAAVNSFDNLASFSNYGAGNVHVAAPGVGILSTVPDNGYSTMSGTSMAAPFVSGMAALALSEAPQLTGYQVKEIILSSSDVSASLASKVKNGTRVNVYRMLMAAQARTGESAYQPDYSPVYGQDSRSPASEGSGPEMKSSGCGSLALLRKGGPRIPPSPQTIPWVLLILAAPLMVWYYLKFHRPESRRRFDRFRMDSEIRIKVGDRELIGSTKTISAGGVSFNVDQALEKGGMVTLQIASPDGQDKIEVQGHIVWNEKNHAYGVSFAETRTGVTAAIQSWTRSLIRQN